MITTIKIKGTHCDSCKALIEDVCMEQSAAHNCQVNYQTGETVIEHDDSFNWQRFKLAVEQLGDYQVNLPIKPTS